jgi:hypothetical protein
MRAGCLHQPTERKAESQFYLSEKVAAQGKEIIEAALRESQGRLFGPLEANTARDGKIRLSPEAILVDFE